MMIRPKNNWLDFKQFNREYSNVPVKEYPNHVVQTVRNPVVSVILLTYNHANYIRDAIDSILMQEANFSYEIILGDDDSNDGTREICIEYAEKYPHLIRLMMHKRENNIRVLDKPSLIFQFGYNLYQCRGRFVAFLSGDDFWTDPLKLKKQVEFLLENDAKYAYCYQPYKLLFCRSDKEVLSKHTVNKYWICTSMCINVFEKLPKQLFEVRNEDVFIEYILMTYGKGANIISLKPAIYRQTSNSNWASQEELFRLKGRVLVAEKMLEFFKGTDLEKTLKKRLYRKYYRAWARTKQISFFVQDEKLSLFKYIKLIINKGLLLEGISYHCDPLINGIIHRIKSKLDL